jgi:hypothetical protein
MVRIGEDNPQMAVLIWRNIVIVPNSMVYDGNTMGFSFQRWRFNGIMAC